jgi:hypothetical protein
MQYIVVLCCTGICCVHSFGFFAMKQTRYSDLESPTLPLGRHKAELLLKEISNATHKPIGDQEFCSNMVRAGGVGGGGFGVCEKGPSSHTSYRHLV